MMRSALPLGTMRFEEFASVKTFLSEQLERIGAQAAAVVASAAVFRNDLRFVIILVLSDIT